MYYILQYYIHILCVSIIYIIISTTHVGMYIYIFTHSYIPKQSSWKPFTPILRAASFPLLFGTFVVALGGGFYDVAFVLAHSFSIVVALVTFSQWQGRRFDHRLKWLGKDEQSFKKNIQKSLVLIDVSYFHFRHAQWACDLACQVVIPSQIKSVVLCNVAFFIMFLGSQQIQPKWCLQV